MPFFCPLLPNTRSIRTGSTTRRVGAVLRRRAHSQPSGRAEAQPLLPGWPARERRRDRVHGHGAEACRLAVEENRIDYCATAPPGRVPRGRREVRDQPSRRAVLRQPRARDLVLRLQPRPAGVQGAGADPAEEGDQLRARPARARAGVRLSRRQADGPDAAARAGARRRHLFAQGRRPGDRAEVARPGAVQAEHARPLRMEHPASASPPRRCSPST